MNKISLDNLKQEINTWRSTKPSMQSRIPSELKEKIIELSKSVKKSKIISELNLSSSFSFDKSSIPKTNFIKAILPPKSANKMLTISLKNGIDIIIYQ